MFLVPLVVWPVLLLGATLKLGAEPIVFVIQLVLFAWLGLLFVEDWLETYQQSSIFTKATRETLTNASADTYAKATGNTSENTKTKGKDAKNKTPKTVFALVTGASAGLGREFALLLAEKHFSLVLVARREDRLQELQHVLQEQYAEVTVHICCCDLATPSGIAKLLTFLNTKKINVDVLINNAGASWTSPFIELSAEKLEELLQLNVHAATQLTHALVPGMVERKRGGRVLFISSLAATVPNPDAAIYGASKSYIAMLGQALNCELRGTGVSVTCFHPGPINTEFGQVAKCEQALYMQGAKLTAVAPRECAQRALDAMFGQQNVVFDSIVTQFMGWVLQNILPRRLSVLLAGLFMQEQKNAWAFVKKT